VTETGWGEFDIVIKVFFAPESNEKPLTFNHHLKLHPWPVDPILYAQPTATGEPSIPTIPGQPPASLPPPVLSPVHSWQYEELCFNEPTEAFYAVLLEHKPTPLPKSNRFPKLLTHPLSAGGNIGEFSLEMEEEEAARIEKAREKTLAQIEDLRRQLVSHEQELQGSFRPPCLLLLRTRSGRY
jgi:YEATS domain-containing protein 4